MSDPTFVTQFAMATQEDILRCAAHARMAACGRQGEARRSPALPPVLFLQSVSARLLSRWSSPSSRHTEPPTL